MSVWRKPFRTSLVELAFRLHFRREFLRLVRASPEVDVSWTLVDQRASEMFERVAREIPDRGSQTVAVMSAYVASAYKELRVPLGPLEARERLIGCLNGFGHGAAWFSLRAVVASSEDPVSELFGRLKRSIASFCGPSFEFSFEDEPRAATLVINRCGFLAMMRKFQVPEAMPIFCRWDQRFLIDFASGAPGAGAHVASRLANGDDCCRFEFHRDTAGELAKFVQRVKQD